MSTDHDIMRLPDPPPPAPDARAAALQQALVRFDQKSAEDSQGMPTGIRLIERTAAPLRPSRERPVMNRTRYLLAASLACVVAGSGVYLHLMRSPQLQGRCARRTAGGQQRCRSSSFASAGKEGKRKPGPAANANPNRHSRLESPTRKPPCLRLLRRRLPPSRAWKIRSSAGSLRRRLPRGRPAGCGSRAGDNAAC